MLARSAIAGVLWLQYRKLTGGALPVFNQPVNTAC
jgi:hypothetical protein